MSRNVTMDVGRGYLLNSLKMLFEQAEVSFVIDGDVARYAKNELVTFHVHNMPFRDALEALLMEARHEDKRLTYTGENGIYRIHAQYGTDLIQSPVALPRAAPIPLSSRYVHANRESRKAGDVLRDLLETSQSDYVICALRDTGIRFVPMPEVIRLPDAMSRLAADSKMAIQYGRQESIAWVRAGNYDISRWNDLRVDLSLNDVDLVDCLNAIFDAVGAEVRISPYVAGSVTAHLKGVTLRSALECLLRHEDALTYQVESSVFDIKPKGYAEPESKDRADRRPARPTITVNFESLPLMEALRLVAGSARLRLEVDDCAKGCLELYRPVSLHEEHISIDDALTMILVERNNQAIRVEFYVKDRTLYISARPNLPTNFVSLNEKQVKLDDALHAVFSRTSKPFAYSVREQANQRFSFLFENTPFQIALSKITSSVLTPGGCKIDTSDDGLILVLSPNPDFPLKEPVKRTERFTVRARDASVRLVLKTLFVAAGANFTLEQTLQGKISIDLKGSSLDDALVAIIHKISNSFFFWVENGVYCVAPKVEVTPESTGP